MGVLCSGCIFFLSFTVFLFQDGHAACSVNVNSGDMPWPQPLMLAQGADETLSSYLAPDIRGNITVNEDSEVQLFCPGGGFKLFNNESVNVYCQSDQVFIYENTSYTLNAFACTEIPMPVAEITETACENGTVIYISYNVTNQFYQLFDVCFDTNELTPRYSHATIVASISGFQQSVPRPKWIADDLYDNVDMDNQYKTQFDTLFSLVGANRTAFGTNYLSRGHLVAKADFPLAAQQIATFSYVNSAPQWYGFNTGNWNQLELDVRNFASANNYDLEVYTGTHGVLTLPDAEGNQKDIYLYSSKTENKVPVPMLFWKIVYEPQSKMGMVFVGVNNPLYNTNNLPPEYRICDDVCNDINWLHWKPTNETAGIAYCCEYNAFKAIVTTAPDLNITRTFAPPSSGVSSMLAFQILTILFSLSLAIHHLF